MHPEIIKNSPGSCPKCGMALEPMMPSLEEEENPELVDFQRRFWYTLPLTLIVFFQAMFGHQLHLVSMTQSSWIEFIFTIPSGIVGR
jgi:Cu+-exporting ATPase